MELSANDDSPKYPGKPLIIFEFNKSDQNAIQNASTELKQILTHKDVKTRNVSVISIIGAFRKGKSFMLDYFLRFMYSNYKSVGSPSEPLTQKQRKNWIGNKDEPLAGFTWKGGASRNTTGIIIWSDVFLYDNPNGDKIAILLMDTQGLFDHKSSPTDNSRIFSLSTLISSVQIFNLFNNIQEDHLQYLQFATGFAHYVKNETKSGRPFQNLLFLIRDWGASDDFSYGLNGGKDLLAQILEVNKNQKPELRSLREYIFKSFDKISCFLMPHPGLIVATKKDYDGCWAQIDPKFIDYLKILVETLLTPENLTIKKVNYENLKTGDLYSYILEYVKIYKSEDLPKVQSIYEATVSNNMQILLAKALAFYTEKSQSDQQSIENEMGIQYLHQTAEHAALELFDGARKMGSEEHNASVRATLCQSINGNFEMWKVSAMAQIASIEVHRNEVARLQREVLQAQRGGCMKACGCGALRPLAAVNAMLCCFCKINK